MLLRQLLLSVLSELHSLLCSLLQRLGYWKPMGVAQSELLLRRMMLLNFWRPLLMRLSSFLPMDKGCLLLCKLLLLLGTLLLRSHALPEPGLHMLLRPLTGTAPD